MLVSSNWCIVLQFCFTISIFYILCGISKDKILLGFWIFIVLLRHRLGFVFLSQLKSETHFLMPPTKIVCLSQRQSVIACQQNHEWMVTISSEDWIRRTKQQSSRASLYLWLSETASCPEGCTTPTYFFVWILWCRLRDNHSKFTMTL